MAYIISIKSNFLKLLENYGGLICGVIFNTFTAGAIFRNPPRNADDEFYVMRKLLQKCRWRIYSS